MGDGDPASDRQNSGDDPADPATAEGLGRRGWVLVAALIVSFLVIPTAIVLIPPNVVPFRAAYLALPTIPAMVLAALAVWSAVGARRDG